MTVPDSPSAWQPVPGPPGVEAHIGAAGETILALRSNDSSANLSLAGGQVLHWGRHGRQPVLWLSGLARIESGRAIRGGVPICWPWFGPSATPGLPSHGVARTSHWHWLGSRTHADGTVEAELALPGPGASAPPHCPPGLGATLSCRVGQSLTLRLTTRNDGNATVTLSEALHSYFRVADVRHIRIQGLDSQVYVDQLQGNARCVQQGPVTFAGEVDRVFVGSHGECWVEDPQWARCIRIRKQGSASTVVWNPWIEKTLKLPDMAPQAYLEMVCVESANAFDHTLRLEPGEEHVLTVEYHEEDLPDAPEH